MLHTRHLPASFLSLKTYSTESRHIYTMYWKLASDIYAKRTKVIFTCRKKKGATFFFISASASWYDCGLSWFAILPINHCKYQWYSATRGTPVFILPTWKNKLTFPYFCAGVNFLYTFTSWQRRELRLGNHCCFYSFRWLYYICLFVLLQKLKRVSTYKQCMIFFITDLILKR